MPSRFYCPVPLAAQTEVVLPPEVAHHALRVLRLRYGEAVAVFDGQGVEYGGTLIDAAGQAAVRLTGQALPSREAPLAITLMQGLAVADKMDWIVQKAVEMGVAAVHPVEAERSVLKLTGDRADKRLAHWRQVAISAAEQCGRNQLCAVAPVARLAQWLAQPFAGQRWILAPGEGSQTLAAQPRPSGAVALLIGPEGGWSEREIELAKSAGCQAVRLGPRILRTETAGVAAVAAMMALWGDY